MLELTNEIDNADASRFSVLTEGEPRTLKPQIHDEVCGIGREAVINAWRHANPQHVIVHLRYGNDCLTIEIADDGCGMDSKTILHGREGHWGLTGMRERAERVGARLRIESEMGHGTRILLIVPARLAFGTERKRNLPKAIA
jgi:signal transduction histidine kinase